MWSKSPSILRVPAEYRRQSLKMYSMVNKEFLSKALPRRPRKQPPRMHTSMLQDSSISWSTVEPCFISVPGARSASATKEDHDHEMFKLQLLASALSHTRSSTLGLVIDCSYLIVENFSLSRRSYQGFASQNRVLSVLAVNGHQRVHRQVTQFWTRRSFLHGVSDYDSRFLQKRIAATAAIARQQRPDGQTNDPPCSSRRRGRKDSHRRVPHLVRHRPRRTC